MTRRRAIKGVLGNFLETFTSRYSDYDGYWLFGFLVNEMEQLTINLLQSNTCAGASIPMAFAFKLAPLKFKEQMEKAGLEISCLKEACLVIKKPPQHGRGVVNGRFCDGYYFSFLAKAGYQAGKTYESHRR